MSISVLLFLYIIGMYSPIIPRRALLKLCTCKIGFPRLYVNLKNTALCEYLLKYAGKYLCTIPRMVLARISKMPVQNSIINKISARPDLATQLLQILMPTTFNSLSYQKGQFTLLPSLRR